MSWRDAPLGRAHWLEVDDVGLVSRCGKWRPAAPTPLASASTARCLVCLRLFADRDLPNPVADPAPEEHATMGIREAAAKRNAGIRRYVATNPSMPVTEVARFFGVSEAVARRALKSTRTEKASKAPHIEAALRAAPHALASVVAQRFGVTTTYVGQIRKRMRWDAAGVTT